MPGNLLTSMFVLWVGGSVTHLTWTQLSASVLVTLVAGALFVSRYFFIPLCILAHYYWSYGHRSCRLPFRPRHFEVNLCPQSKNGKSPRINAAGWGARRCRRGDRI